MKPLLRLSLAYLLLAGGSVSAQDSPSAAESLMPRQRGYAFDRPDLLLRQRIFGLAHGVHLLLSGCLDKAENAEAVQQAYDVWHETQRVALESVRLTLAEHHFGEQGERAHWQDIARVLGLKETIYPSLGTVPLPEACATLPQVLTQDRYDFAAQLRLADASFPLPLDMADPADAVSRAPTSTQADEPAR